MKSVLIIGCGWLGRITAALLIESGYSVTGTTRTKNNFDALAKLGITPHELDIKPNIEVYVPEADVILISLSPNRRDPKSDYIGVLKTLGKALSASTAQILMCSSTFVYDELTGTVLEEDLEPVTDHPNRLLVAEGVLNELIPESTILRLGGIYGYERHPVYHLSGRKKISRGDAPVNLIHADDAAAITKLLIEKEVNGEVLNLVAPEHPTRNDLYHFKAREFGIEEPEFLGGGEEGKVIDSSKIVTKFGYRFKYSNPMEADTE